MAMQHHGGGRNTDSELMRRFMEQATGTASREYTAGRMGAEDEGSLTYAIATDHRHRAIVIRFPKPTEWIGLTVKDAEELIQQLTVRSMELRGIRADC